jgi:hypothetical protein
LHWYIAQKRERNPQLIVIISGKKADVARRDPGMLPKLLPPHGAIKECDSPVWQKREKFS